MEINEIPNWSDHVISLELSLQKWLLVYMVANWPYAFVLHLNISITVHPLKVNKLRLAVWETTFN